MSRRNARLLFAPLAALALLAGCGKTESPKVDAATERQQAHDRAAKDVFGAQVQAVDKAKAMQDDLNKKAQESVDKIEKDAK